MTAAPGPGPGDPNCSQSAEHSGTPGRPSGAQGPPPRRRDPPPSCGAAAAAREERTRPSSPSPCGPAPASPSPPGPAGWPSPGSAWVATSPGRRRPRRHKARLSTPPPRRPQPRWPSPSAFPGTCRSRGSRPMCSKPNASGSAMPRLCGNSAHARTAGRARRRVGRRHQSASRAPPPPGRAGDGLPAARGAVWLRRCASPWSRVSRGRRGLSGTGPAHDSPLPHGASVCDS